MNRTSHHPIARTLAAACCAAWLAAPAVAAPDDALAVLSYVKYEDAFNRGQVETALEQFTDDASVVAGPACTAQKPCIGKAAIREGLLQRFIAANIGVTVRELSFDGAQIRTRVEITNDVVRQRGFKRIVGSDTIQVRDGKIASLVFKADASDEETGRYLQAQAAAVAAAQQQR